MSNADAVRYCHSAEEAPPLSGAYVLLIELPQAAQIKIGHQAPIALATGRYLYCGSAKGPGGLRARLARHFQQRKIIRWHVDQLTTRGHVIGSWIVPGGDECKLVAMLHHLPVPIVGFGSSDCAACQSHLVSWPPGVALPFEVRGPLSAPITKARAV